ncbi:fab1 [Bugula neritina]|uniref:Fab1 n=1 Tax=Bugula neritina TaxID=10212 RepID=A0A7J7JA98_BUGNE|nr:fab1 [Bugula neritina]
MSVLYNATPLVPLSPAAWHLSFARFLQIQFNGGLSGSQVGEDCVHSMSTHYHQYFQFKGAVAIFKPSGITLREVVFPSPHVLMEHKISNKDIESRVKRIHTHGLGFFSDIMEIICKIEANSAENKEKWKTNPDYKLDLESEKKWFTEETDRMQSALLTETDPLTDTSLNLQKLSDDAIRLQFHLARSVQEWNIKIERANTNEEKIGDKKRLEDRSPKHFGSVPQLYGVGSKEESVAGSIEIYQTTPTPSESVYSAAVSSKDPEGPVLSAVDIVERLVHNDSPSSFDSASGIFSSSLCNEYDLGHYHQSVNEGLRAGLGRALTVNSYDSVGSFVVCDASTSIETAVPTEHKGRNSEQVIMSSSAQSQQMTPSDVNTQRSSENKNMADQVLPLPHADETIKAHEKLADDVTDVSAANTIKTASAGAALDHLDDSKYQAVGNKVAAFSSVTKDSRLLTRHSVANDGKEVTQRRGGSKRTKRLKRNSSRYLLESVKSAIMSTAEDIPLFIKPIDNPFSDNEHYLLPSTPNVPIIIYDEEPSSIIAYALGSHDYDEQLTAKAEMIAKGPSTMSSEKDIKTDEIEVILKLTSVSAVSESLSKSSKLPDTPTNLLVVGDSKSKDRSAPAEINPHIEMEFTEKSVSGEKTGLFYCKVYFAAEFKKLRELIYPEGEEQFIRSLSRCYKWNAKGGKSGLGFCKTQDDRFIMKQMVKQEVQSFLDFGPYYFDYLTESLTDSGFPKERCALAKILGVYKIGLKNFVTNAVFRQDVLIIENLFYNRHIGKVFDLKGSDRNRLTKRETSLDSVLLDENFMRYSKQNPIYVRNHTKLVLMNALMEDTQFLARHKVMDYSLLCGYDEDTKELVIGIIDYIRTFTWDKRLETYVKSSGFLGGQGKMPTIVSPEVYRNRFLEAMEKYFHVVPDRWSKFPYFYPVKM